MGYFTDMIIYGAGIIKGNAVIAYVKGFAGSLCILIICTLFDKVPKLSSVLSIIGASTITILCLHFHLLYPAKVLYKVLLNGDPVPYILFMH